MLTTIKQLQTLADVARAGKYEGRWIGYRPKQGRRIVQFPRMSIVSLLRVKGLVKFVDAPTPYVFATPRGLEYLDHAYEDLFPELARAVTELHKAELFALGFKDSEVNRHD